MGTGRDCGRAEGTVPELAAGAAGWCSVTEKISKGWWLGGTQEKKIEEEERLIDEKTSQLVQPAPKPQESISYWASPPVPMATQFGALQKSALPPLPPS